MTNVSVVVPTRNRCVLLATALRSVLWQEVVELDIIVVDEASTDRTGSMVAALGDPRITLLRNETPRGPSVARNQGAERARGEWVAFLDDDDVWAPRKLARQAAAAEDSASDWAYVGSVNVAGGLEIVSGRPVVSPSEVLAALPRYNPIPGGGSNVMIRRRLFEAVGGFDERLVPCEDWELWARLARSGPPALVPAPLLGYRLHTGNASLDLERISRAARLIEELHGVPVDWGRLHRWFAESCLRTESHAQALGEFARAAVRGQARNVARDLADILSRRFTHPGDDPAAGMTADEQNWRADASSWLRALTSRVSADNAESVCR